MALALALLPRFSVLKSGGKYLTVPENLQQNNLPSGFLKFDEEQIWSPSVKFAVEEAATGDGRFVHIRSCCNNKYWVAEPIQQLLWIVAAADKPEEDQSKDNCTLFEPVSSSGNGTVRLRHVQTGKTLISKSPGPYVPSFMFQGVEVSKSTTGGLFDIIDWETLVILPSNVAFRSEELVDHYLCSRVLDQRYPYQRFESGLDIGDPLAFKVLFPTPDGNYRVRDSHFGKFWRRSPNWIWADGEENNNSNDTIFSIVKISDKVIALRNLGNNNFCGPLTTEGKTNCLNAQYPTISRQARLIIEERVLQRNITDVRYRLSDSRIYQEEIQEVSHAFATNNSLENESAVTLTYKTSDSRTAQWTNSVSITSGVKAEIKISFVPFIIGGKMELSTEIGYTYQWGVSETTVRNRDASYVVVVPPMKTIKVSLMCTKANCDVPFSYIQKDLLTSGERVTTLKDDGIFTGINSYNFYMQSSEVTMDAQGRAFI